VRKVFISYARKNKRDVEQLVEHLRVLGCEIWHDSSLHGGQDWWNEILRRIADCDTFIAIISREALNSTACRREFDWANLLEKPVLPVAVESQPKALPRRFSERQIVDYSDPAARDRAALLLAGGLATLSASPPLPDPMPEPPAAPLSYLTDLIDLVAEQKALDHDQQRHILNHLEHALQSIDPEERRGGHDILEMLSSRDDLYADVYRTINRLKDIVEGPTPVRSSDLGDDGASPEKTTQPGHTDVDEHLGDLIEHPTRPAKNTPIDVVDTAAADRRSGDGGSRAGPKGDAVSQRFRQLFLVQVGPRGRRYNPKIVGSAVAVALVTVAAIVVVANHNRADNQQLYRAYVLPPAAGLTGINVYAEPKVTSPLVANLPQYTDVYIVCVAVGDSVDGPGPTGQPRVTTPVWDKVRSEVNGHDLGFVPDAWVNTNGTAPRAPNC
jgi:TIR domain